MQWPLPAIQTDSHPSAGSRPRRPNPQFPARPTCFGSPATLCSAASSLAHTHAAVTCEMRSSPLTHRAVARPMSFVPRSSPLSFLRDDPRSACPPSGFPAIEPASARRSHSCPRDPRACTRSTPIFKGVDPSFDIPLRSCPRSSRLQQTPATVARAYMSAAQRTTVSVPQDDESAKSTHPNPVSQVSSESRPKYLQALVTQNSATPTTVLVPGYPSGPVRLTTYPETSYPAPLYVSQHHPEE